MKMDVWNHNLEIADFRLFEIRWMGTVGPGKGQDGADVSDLVA